MCYGPVELYIGDPTAWVWAMGPVAHARNVCSRSDHYCTTRGGATPRLCRIDCKILSSSAREAGTISRLINVLVSRMNYMDGGYGSWPQRDSPQNTKL